MDKIWEELSEFKTLAQESYGEYKEKGSKFIGFAYPLENESDPENRIAEIKKIHHKARHWCYAYTWQGTFRSNDDGEPSGTAGKPIENQLKSYDLENTLIIVVRYFGGTKLGTSGLINAYKTASKEALDNAEIIIKSKFVNYELKSDYENMGLILNTLKKLNIEIDHKDFSDDVKINICILISDDNRKIQEVKAQLLNISMDALNDSSIVPFCKFKKSGICLK
jgi:uncharacterized YigZ family protein